MIAEYASAVENGGIRPAVSVDPSDTGNATSNRQTIVVKIGTSSICNEETQQPRMSALATLVESLVNIKSQGYNIVLVTSGAIGVGMRAVGIHTKPKQTAAKQALAALGQGRLMSLYDHLFSQYDQRIGQVLLTRHDLAERSNYLHACNTLRELLSMGAIPVINENDTVSISSIRFGNNDTLAAIAAGMVKADWLFLLTDVDALYTDNPRKNPDARPVYKVSNLPELMCSVNTSSSGSAVGTGGMTTKLEAAKLCSAAGINCIIASSQYPERMLEIVEDASVPEPRDDSERKLTYTHFVPHPSPMVDRKWWILHTLHPAGSVTIDEDAYRAITEGDRNGSLLAAGIDSVNGDFVDQDPIEIYIDNNDSPVGMGLVNFSSADISKIKGCESRECADILGLTKEVAECVIHPDNLAIDYVEVAYVESSSASNSSDS